MKQQNLNSFKTISCVLLNWKQLRFWFPIIKETYECSASPAFFTLFILPPGKQGSLYSTKEESQSLWNLNRKRNCLSWSLFPGRLDGCSLYLKGSGVMLKSVPHQRGFKTRVPSTISVSNQTCLFINIDIFFSSIIPVPKTTGNFFLVASVSDSRWALGSSIHAEFFQCN